MVSFDGIPGSIKQIDKESLDREKQIGTFTTADWFNGWVRKKRLILSGESCCTTGSKRDHYISINDAFPHFSLFNFRRLIWLKEYDCLDL